MNGHLTVAAQGVEPSLGIKLTINSGSGSGSSFEVSKFRVRIKVAKVPNPCNPDPTGTN